MKPLKLWFLWVLLGLSLTIVPGCSCGDDDDDDDTTPECGNDEVEEGEECDDGNTDPGDGCSATCQNEGPECGNGDLETGEECDDGNTDPGDGCSATCTEEAECGNDEVEEDEECDDGNTDPGDGCDADCGLESCGDSVVNNTDEACDDGNTDACDGCAADCSREDDACGDGTAECGETCDDGADNGVYANPANCNTTCDGDGPHMGDGTVNGPEECDDGNTVDGDGCSANGQIEECGDGAVNNNGAEVCDDGNIADCDGCAADCSRADNVCGDGVTECGEACDTGDAGCVVPGCTFCGNGALDAGETCDSGANNGVYANPANCNTTCDGDGPHCGDTVVNGSEECDGGENCRANCTIITSGPIPFLTAEPDGNGNIVVYWTRSTVDGTDAASYDLVLLNINAPLGAAFTLADDTTALSYLWEGGASQCNVCEVSPIEPGPGAGAAATPCLGGAFQLYASNGQKSNLLVVNPCNTGCGNGIPDEGEQCDLGRKICVSSDGGGPFPIPNPVCTLDGGNGTPTYGCTQICTLRSATCGDGLLNGAGEECDGLEGTLPENGVCDEDNCVFGCSSGFSRAEGACAEACPNGQVRNESGVCVPLF